ncbi:MAG: ABC transporter ATP-binding protein [Rhodoblastus sp.]|nr:ABC transporter ATP-binding protein [Rhodoblastus sp.]
MFASFLNSAIPLTERSLRAIANVFERPPNASSVNATPLHHAASSPPPPRAIRLQNIVKEYHTPIGRRRVLDNISCEIAEGEKLAILGRNGAGKSTLVKLLGGVEPSTSGTIDRELYMSWPLAFAGALDNKMTGRDNARFIARIYNQPFHEMLEFVNEFAELGRQIDIPVRDYSMGMRMRLAFALTLAVDFECFLIDEILSVGDQRFHRKCHDALFVQRKHRAMILVSHDVNTIRNYCSKALVLKGGRGRVFDDIDLAIKIYQTL